MASKGQPTNHSAISGKCPNSSGRRVAGQSERQCESLNDRGSRDANHSKRVRRPSCVQLGKSHCQAAAVRGFLFQPMRMPTILRPGVSSLGLLGALPLALLLIQSAQASDWPMLGKMFSEAAQLQTRFARRSSGSGTGSFPAKES